ncbi:MAG: hypothetical protein AB9872_13285 [Solidesulfovibrio sp.]
MARGRTTIFEVLDRLGLLKYILASLLTGAAFAMTAGAYVYEEISSRPPRLPDGFSLADKTPEAAAGPGFALRAPAVRTVRFAAGAEPSAGFAFYDITANETPKSLAEKLVRKQFRISRGRGESCNFAYPLSNPVALKEAVAAFIRDRSRQCCAVSDVLPGQLATYAFSLGDNPDTAKIGPISGTAVFSQVGAGLLTLNLRFSEKVEGYAATMTNYLGQRLGPPIATDKTGAAWAREGGLVTMARNGRALSVTTYFAANIERHAALAVKLADRPGRPPDVPKGRLAVAVAP